MPTTPLLPSPLLLPDPLLGAGPSWPRFGGKLPPPPGKACGPSRLPAPPVTLPEPTFPAPAPPQPHPFCKNLPLHMEQNPPTLRKKCRNVHESPPESTQKRQPNGLSAHFSG